MPYVTTRDLKNDVLFRASESTTGSNYDGPAVDYLNRVYRTLCNGASEFLPEYVEDWWWLRENGVLTLLPSQTGGASFTQDDVNITFNVAPTMSVAGWRIRIDGQENSDLYEIATHTALSGSATLDSPYTGGSVVGANYTLMKVRYDLGVDVASLIAPLVGFRGNPTINGLSPERMDILWPISELRTGVPAAFALEDERVVRFSAGGRTDGKSMRIEYRYRPTIAELTDDAGSIPRVPLHWRHVLSDMALTYVLLDKNDDRSNAVALAARTGLAGMLKENRRRIPKMDSEAGHIFARGDIQNNRGPLRTESGLIIG